MSNPINARFWGLINDSPVKITIKPGHSLHWRKVWCHEEGWSAEAVTWFHEIDHIDRQSMTDGTDCDGRLSTFTECRCTLGSLGGYRPSPHAADVPESLDAYQFPQWERVRGSQRDQYAETMGY